MDFGMKGKQAMIFIIIAIAILVVACYLLKKESDREIDFISVESYAYESDKIAKSIKVVFLSDLHDKEFGENNSRLFDTIISIKPDVILIGGDTMNVRIGKISLRVTENLLETLKKIAPVYYCNGNNEQRLTWEREEFEEYRSLFLKLLEQYNIHYLDDSYEDILGNIRLLGLNLELDHYKEFKHKKLTKNFMDCAVRKVDNSKFNLLLCHSPMFIDTYAEWGADLVLTGHSHGGVIRFPTDKNKEKGKIDNDRGLISGQYQLFHKYCAGVFWKNKTCMIVSRGLGTHTVNIRINNLPQIVVVDLEPMCN